ncbi:hypothetical protein [Actinoplanes sp. NPDC023714]|uniref:hypothetical protein n=1 Tax=Actinoplanes sp. NPDC023714 TaxID=3154322 RepID=UPI0033E7CF9B
MKRSVLRAVVTAGILAASAVVGSTPASASQVCAPYIYPDAGLKGAPICFGAGTNGKWVSLGSMAYRASSLYNPTKVTWCLRTAGGATWNFWGPATWSYFGEPYNDAFVEAKSSAC